MRDSSPCRPGGRFKNQRCLHSHQSHFFDNFFIIMLWGRKLLNLPPKISTIMEELDIEELNASFESHSTSPRKVVTLAVEQAIDETPVILRSASATPVNNAPLAPQRDEDLEPMRYGDVVYLEGTVAAAGPQAGHHHHADDIGGYLCADPAFLRVGFQQLLASEGCGSRRFQNALFQVCHMLSYDNKVSKSKLEVRRGEA